MVKDLNHDNIEYMEQEVLRDSTNPEEILSIILELCKSKAQILCWQNQEKERVVAETIFKTVDEHNRLIEIGMTDKSKEFKFDDKLPVFFREESKKLLFRQKVSCTSKKMIEAKLPDTIKLIDRRHQKRETYKLTKDEKSGMIIEFSMKSDIDQSFKDYVADLYDISNSGVAFRINKKISKHFQEGKTIKIKKLKMKELDEVVEGDIIYMKTFEDKSRLHESIFCRLGVAFKKEVFIVDTPN